MIASRQETPSAVIRIHDEHCLPDPQETLTQLNHIIAAAHKRDVSQLRYPQPHR